MIKFWTILSTTLVLFFNLVIAKQTGLKISLSDKCGDTYSDYLAKSYLLGNYKEGKKYNFRIAPPKLDNEIRIAIAGDSATQGSFGWSLEEIFATPEKDRLID